MYINNGARTGLARVTLHCWKVNFRAFAFPCFFLKFFYLFVINVYGVSALCGMDSDNSVHLHSFLHIMCFFLALCGMDSDNSVDLHSFLHIMCFFLALCGMDSDNSVHLHSFLHIMCFFLALCGMDSDNSVHLHSFLHIMCFFLALCGMDSDNSVHLHSFLPAHHVFLPCLMWHGQRQLSAPTFIHSCTSCVSSSPVVITCQSTTDYNSSVRACSAIFSPDPPRVASLPTSQEFWAAQETGSALQKWIVHHKTLTSRFRPELVKCEGETAVWSDVAVTPARVLVPIESQHIVFDSLDQLTHPSVKAGMTLIKRPYWWQGIGSGVSKWTKACEACQKRLK